MLPIQWRLDNVRFPPIPAMTDVDKVVRESCGWRRWHGIRPSATCKVAIGSQMISSVLLSFSLGLGSA